MPLTLKKSIKSNGHKQSLKGPGGQKEGVRNCAPPWSSLLWPLCLYLLICFLLSLTHMVGTEHGGKAVGFSSTWRPCSSRWGKRWWAKRQEMHPNPKSLLEPSFERRSLETRPSGSTERAPRSPSWDSPADSHCLWPIEERPRSSCHLGEWLWGMDETKMPLADFKLWQPIEKEWGVPFS